MNGSVIFQHDVQRQLRLATLIVLTCALFTFNSCSGLNDHADVTEYLDIYYTMGYVDSDGPCEKDFLDREVLDKGKVYMGRQEYETITELLEELEASSDSITTTYGMCLQSNFHFADSSSIRVCIGQFRDITMNGKSFVREDSLIYLLRKYSGFYNYYNREDLMSFCKELSLFGVPEDYQDLSSNLDTINNFYAKIRILVE